WGGRVGGGGDGGVVVCGRGRGVVGIARVGHDPAVDADGGRGEVGGGVVAVAVGHVGVRGHRDRGGAGRVAGGEHLEGDRAGRAQVGGAACRGGGRGAGEDRRG